MVSDTINYVNFMVSDTIYNIKLFI